MEEIADWDLNSNIEIHKSFANTLIKLQENLNSNIEIHKLYAVIAPTRV